MGKLVMWNMITLDGFFEGPGKGQLDWFLYDEDLQKYMDESQTNLGTFLFGRVTYEGMQAYWTTAEGATAELMNRINKVVFSTTLEKADWNNTRLVKGNLKQEIANLKQQSQDTFLVGSADLAATLMQEGLIDEYRIGINPVILGRGTRLFPDEANRINLKLVDSKRLQSGLVLLHYQPT